MRETRCRKSLQFQTVCLFSRYLIDSSIVHPTLCVNTHAFTPVPVGIFYTCGYEQKRPMVRIKFFFRFFSLLILILKSIGCKDVGEKAAIPPAFGTALDTMSIEPYDMGTCGQDLRACRVRIRGYTKGPGKTTWEI